MNIGLFCSNCAKAQLCTVDPTPVDAAMTLQRFVECLGWIVQLNGDHMDIYCCPRCAK